MCLKVPELLPASDPMCGLVLEGKSVEYCLHKPIFNLHKFSLCTQSFQTKLN